MINFKGCFMKAEQPFFMNTVEKIYSLFRQYRYVSTDTRNLKKGSLFFALSGQKFNGNLFADEAIKKGAAAVVVDDPVFFKENDDRYILVENTLNSLQELAKFHRNRLDIPVLAITGTNGKTTTKELCAAVLSSEKKICATKGNFNNHIGVPLTLLSIREETEIAIVEMGANHPGEIGHLCSIAQPTHGLITNIGKAHLEGFGDMQGVIRTKNELYLSVKSRKGTLFVHKDNPLLMKLSEGARRITYGFPPADVEGNPGKSGMFVEITGNKQTKNAVIKTQLYGSYNFSNVMAAIAVGSCFGISGQGMIRALSGYTSKNNRSQILKTADNTLILDAYNANPESMMLAIQDFVSRQFNNPVLILGDMFELGKASLSEHKKIVDALEDMDIQRVILIGKDFYRITHTSQFQKFTTTEEAGEYLKNHPIKGAHILVKGSRGMELEKLIQYL